MKDIKEEHGKSSGEKPKEKNFKEKKSQENNSHTLLDSQENVIKKLSSALSQSSHSTNVGDLEESLLLAMESGADMHSEEIPSTSLPARYDLRTRSVIKGTKKRIQLETSMTPVTKSTKLSKCEENPLSTVEDFPPMDSLDDHSQESVSMLQECYQATSKNDFPNLKETCINSELEVIDIYSDEETEVPVEREQIMSSCHFAATKVETSTQTDFLVFSPQPNHPKETEMANHAGFINSVIKLKAALSSKTVISGKKLRTVLQSSGSDEDIIMEVDNPEQTLPKETISYLLRSSDVENVFRETVETLLQHLEMALRNDFLKVAYCWKNSIYETVVEMLCKAVDNEAGVWKLVASFLCTIIDSILTDKQKSWILESKANFVISFCQSTRLSYSVVNCAINKIKELKTIQRSGDTPAEVKLSGVHRINKSYFLLTILEYSLEFLKSNAAEERIEGVLIKKPEGKKYNVLEMWKKHWKRDEKQEEQKSGHEWERTVNGWCEILDDILVHCVNHIPVLSIAVERCGQLAKEILKLCHPNVMEEAVSDDKPLFATQRGLTDKQSPCQLK